ncbi:MAG TPA: GNAT family N-acetyltransferase [Opitutaceae bacterium]
MLKGETIVLRLIREADLEFLWARHADVDDRGPYFPIGVIPKSKFQRLFGESGFWSENEGMLVITDKEDAILGHIEFFQTVKYLDEFELSYQIYGSQNRGRGVATEAVRLMTHHLFERSRRNRIRLEWR